MDRILITHDRIIPNDNIIEMVMQGIGNDVIFIDGNDYTDFETFSYTVLNNSVDHPSSYIYMTNVDNIPISGRLSIIPIIKSKRITNLLQDVPKYIYCAYIQKNLSNSNTETQITGGKGLLYMANVIFFISEDGIIHIMKDRNPSDNRIIKNGDNINKYYRDSIIDDLLR